MTDTAQDLRSEMEPLAQGYKRAWKHCKRHDRYGFYDYVPYSLSNPILVMKCGCDAKSCETVTEEVALAALAAPATDEPVAWMYIGLDGLPVVEVEKRWFDPATTTETPLYVHPPAAEPVGLREALEAARDVIQMVEMFDKGTPLLTFVGQKQVERASALVAQALATPARTDDTAQALDEKAIRHDERKKIMAGGCIHTRKAGEQDGDGDRADIRAWQQASSQWFDATIWEIVSEYAAWRDERAGGDVAAMRELAGEIAAIGEEARRHLEIRDRLNRAIYAVLHDYRMSNMVDDEGYGYPLLDLMSNPTPADIGTGEMEMVTLADDIAAAVDKTLSTQAAYSTGAGEGLPADVVSLVVAGREAWEAMLSSDADPEACTALDKALERFASRVCYDDEGGDLPDAHADPCTCGSSLFDDGEGG